MVLDADGVSKAAVADRRAQAFLVSARARDARVVVSAATLAEVLRGGPRDAPAHRVLGRVTKLAVSPDHGRRAGELLGSTGLAEATVDALVAATALEQAGPVLVLTSDPMDLRTLTASRRDVSVERI
ncbi:MAG: PIN domain-containing protein [Actinomycetota bacterium]|nr:PIN domain-containing protein [Actinomycetota bacterium]